MPTSVRLDPETELLLKRLARASGRTKSGVIREALQRMAAAGGELSEPATAYHAVEDLVGIAQDGPEDLAEQHRTRFREKLRHRR